MAVIIKGAQGEPPKQELPVLPWVPKENKPKPDTPKYG